MTSHSLPAGRYESSTGDEAGLKALIGRLSQPLLLASKVASLLAFTTFARVRAGLAGGLHRNVIVLPGIAQECLPKLGL